MNKKKYIIVHKTRWQSCPKGGFEYREITYREILEDGRQVPGVPSNPNYDEIVEKEK